LRALNLLDVTPKTRIVAMFDIINFETIFHINSVGMFVIYLRIHFKIPNPKHSIVRGHKTQENIRTSSSRFDSLQRRCRNAIWAVTKIAGKWF